MSDELVLAERFVQLMSPLVPPGRLALQIHGEASRRYEQQSRARVVAFAKKHRLHKSIRHAQSSIVIDYGLGVNECRGAHLKLKVEALDHDDYVKRFGIIASILVALICLMMTSRR